MENDVKFLVRGDKELINSAALTPFLLTNEEKSKIKGGLMDTCERKLKVTYCDDGDGNNVVYRHVCRGGYTTD